MDANIKRTIILDNYNNPYNMEDVSDSSYNKIRAKNESCIDDITLYLKVNGEVIEDIKFIGEACAISTSTTSIMIKLLINKTIKEAISIILNYQNMIDEKPYDENILGEALVYDEIYKQPNRKKCALLPWDNLYKELIKTIKQ